MRMKATKTVRPLIEHFEGCQLEAYQCSADIWTIGIGHTGATTGIRVTPDDVINYEQALGLFQHDLAAKEAAANRVLAKGIHAGIVSQEVFDAFTSFIFNLGESNARKSTLAKLINQGASHDELVEWWPKYSFAGGQQLPGLKRRRYAELLMALGYEWSIVDGSMLGSIAVDLDTPFEKVWQAARKNPAAPVKKPLSAYSKPIGDLDVDGETAKPLEDSRRVKGVVREKAGDEVAKIGGVVSAPVAVGIAERLATSKPVNEFLILAAVIGVAAIVYGLIKRGYGKAQREAGEAEASQLLF